MAYFLTYVVQVNYMANVKLPPDFELDFDKKKKHKME